MTFSSDTIRQRASVLGLPVYSKATARRLGIVTQIWLDVDGRKVMGLSVAERYLPGTPFGWGEASYLSLDRIAVAGPDALLVDDERVLEDILESERYSNLIGNEVVTESGEPLGKVRDFKFDAHSGDLLYLILASLGSPYIPANLISTYELDVNEIVAVGRDRIIVTEGMEDRLTQLTTGLLERFGLGKPPWEQEFEDEYLPPPTISGNALGSGQRPSTSYPGYSAPPTAYQRPANYRREEMWEEEEENWAEERVSPYPPRRQSQAARLQQPIAPPPPADEDYDEYEDEYYEEAYGERPSNRRYRSEPAPRPSEPRGDRQPTPRTEPNEDARREIRDAWSDEPKPTPIPQRQMEEELEEL